MDIGVGFVICLNGLSANHLRNKLGILERIVKAVKTCFPLIIIGVIRVVVHSALKMPEHVS